MQDRKTDLGLSEFWAHRNDGVTLVIDRLIPYNLAVPFAHGFARAGLTPNQVSIASGAAALGAFGFGIFLASDQALAPILSIYGVSQLSYVLDCANGLIARATDTVSKFGEFFDKSMDMQVSLFGMLLFPIAPDLAYALFAAQTAVLAAVYACYFFRAKDLFDD